MVSRRLSRDGTQITIGFALKTDLAPPDSPCSLSFSCGLVLFALLKVSHLCDGSPFISLHPAAAIWFKAIRGRIIRPSRKAETVVGLPLILSDQTLDFYSRVETHEENRVQHCTMDHTERVQRLYAEPCITGHDARSYLGTDESAGQFLFASDFCVNLHLSVAEKKALHEQHLMGDLWTCLRHWSRNKSEINASHRSHTGPKSGEADLPSAH